MRQNEQGFLKIFIVLVIAVGVLFLYKDKDGVSPGQKLIAKFTGSYEKVKGDIDNIKKLNEAHDQEIRDNL